MKTPPLLIIICLTLSACAGIQPYTKADSTGYEAGVRGKWRDLVVWATNIVDPDGKYSQYTESWLPDEDTLSDKK